MDEIPADLSLDLLLEIPIQSESLASIFKNFPSRYHSKHIPDFEEIKLIIWSQSQRILVDLLLDSPLELPIQLESLSQSERISVLAIIHNVYLILRKLNLSYGLNSKNFS